MKSIQKYRALGILIIAFVFFNTFVMSDSGWVDENENIYSHVNDMVGIGTTTPAGPLHVYPDSDVTLSGGGNIILGDIDGQNIGIDGNEIMARNNGAEGVLHLNADGGDVKIRNNQGGSTRVVFLDNGKVGIGTNNPDEQLTVNGRIHAEEIIVSSVSADFVFEDDYQLASLSKVEEFIEKEGHLPEIPCAAEVEKNGVSLGEMNIKLLQKIEELTLYIIKQDKRIAELEKKILSNE